MTCRFSHGGTCLLANAPHGSPCAGAVDDRMDCPFWSVANSLIAIRKGL